ncbi:MAG: CARDB domain-containing protein, partial [Synechococcaceae cyanobacterium]
LTQQPVVGTILNDDQQTTLSLLSKEVRFAEHDRSNQQVSIQRTGNSSGTISASLRLSTGTATPGLDYKPDTIPLVFEDHGSNLITISLPIIDDDRFEANESFNLDLLIPAGGAILGDISRTVITIENDDPGEADLLTQVVSAPAEIFANRTTRIEWTVQNIGSTATDASRWTDAVYVSATPSINQTSRLLGTLSRTGRLQPNASYTAGLDVATNGFAPGSVYFLVQANAYGDAYEPGRTTNNTQTTAQATIVNPEPKPNLIIQGLSAPQAWAIGAQAEISYTVKNAGNEKLAAYTRERVRLVDGSGKNAAIELANWSTWAFHELAPGDSYQQKLTFTLPSMPLGQWRLEVNADAGNSVQEGNETDNSSAIELSVISPDLISSDLSVSGKRQGGETVTLGWTTTNQGTAVSAASTDRLFLSKDALLDPTDRRLGEVATASLAVGASGPGELTFTLPVDLVGDWHLLVQTDASQTNVEQAGENNNLQALSISVQRDLYADLAVSGLKVPSQVIRDPATISVEWTVTNQGTGVGRTTKWLDRVIYSSNSIIGDVDDIILGEVVHDGALQPGDSYVAKTTYRYPAAFSNRGRVVVQTDAQGSVWENGNEANNSQTSGDPVDILPIPYADLQVEDLSISGEAASGKQIRVNWSVANRGIGITNTNSWSDSIWLSSNPDGSGTRYDLGSAGQLGQLAPADNYQRSQTVTLPNGLSGFWYVNVATGGPFEFIYTTNNKRSSAAIPVQLSPSPDLLVEQVSTATTAQEGSLVEVTWTVLNQGVVTAEGQWQDQLSLLPITGAGSPISLGSYVYDRPLDAGQRYTRTEQIRLPGKIEGGYRIAVTTNSLLGSGSAPQIYEHGGARLNNRSVSSDELLVSLLPRPDLRVSEIVVPESVTAGTSAGLSFTVSNLGSVSTSGAWTDYVFLSLDGILSGDDRLVGRVGSGSALAPTESYRTQLSSVEIPLRYRGDAFFIVVADANNQIDEYPSENNNTRAQRFTVSPVPFADLVTSDVIAPDQAVHGGAIEVRYKVSNKGSAQSRGERSDVNSWTDSVWLTVDRRRPSSAKGDVFLGNITHTGHLAVGDDYLGSVNVQIPKGTATGSYFVTVWSDSYDAIPEDTLASNINLDDATQIDNNNYKATPIAVIGATRPDLVVSQVIAPELSAAGGVYSFSYTVQNRGDEFTGSWFDKISLVDQSGIRWDLGSFEQRQRSLAQGGSYTVQHTVTLAPSIRAGILSVKTDDWNSVAELNETNNEKSVTSIITPSPADLRVERVDTQAQNFSGELTQVSWTVRNYGADVWAGSRGWVDKIFFSSDPELLPARATQIGSVYHDNTSQLLSGESYTTSAEVRLPAGIDGEYFIYVITDAMKGNGWPYVQPEYEQRLGGGNDNAVAHYTSSAYEELRNDNNVGRGILQATYREPDLQVSALSVSNPAPASGETITASWTVTNQGSRATRVSNWFDGLYLSRDNSLDPSDYPLVDRGTLLERIWRLRETSLPLDSNWQPRFLQPGESITNSATFTLPSSISGDFQLILKADASEIRDPYQSSVSTIRAGLPTIAPYGPNSVLEFPDEGNNSFQISLPIRLAPPPDLQVTSVLAPDAVLAGQSFTINYQVENKGGQTPADQGQWNDLIYLSKDRFLDVDKDRFLGYVGHSGGLAAAGSYSKQLTFTAPIDLAGSYYVFVATDPGRVWGAGANGNVQEFGFDQNNWSAALQPLRIETPPPADLQLDQVQLPAQADVGQAVAISFSIRNASINPAYGRWSDAVYLSSDASWDLGDILLGRVGHEGGLGGLASYTTTLNATLPALKDGSWRVIVRPDIYNEVFEGPITYGETGLNIAPGEANNRLGVSAGSLQVGVPELKLATPLALSLNPGGEKLYKLSVAAGETLRVSLDSAANRGSSELYIRWGDVPTASLFDASYSSPLNPDQELLIPSTKAGDYYILVRSPQTEA